MVLILTFAKGVSLVTNLSRNVFQSVNVSFSTITTIAIITNRITTMITAVNSKYLIYFLNKVFTCG